MERGEIQLAADSGPQAVREDAKIRRNGERSLGIKGQKNPDSNRSIEKAEW
jgi:hypothetical protein